MKKAGIITFHCANNYGAVLQTYALRKVIESYNIEAEIINFVPEYINKDYALLFSVNDGIKTNGFRKTIRMLLSRIKNAKIIISRNKNFNKFRKKYLKLSDKIYRTSDELRQKKPYYDYYITGSDQVWNPDFFTAIGGSYFLDFTPDDCVKISYAASVSNDSAHLYYKEFSDALSRFDYISVREKTAKPFISQFTSKDVRVTLDPSLLLSREQWRAIATYDFTKDKYILVYDLVKDPVIIAVANKIAKESGYKILSYSNKRGYINWYGTFRACNPTDFIGLFEKAEVVISSSFHGTVFAILFNKLFYTIPHPTRGIRMIDLLDELELTDRLITDAGQINHLNKDIDYDKVNNRLNAMKEDSMKFLKEALGVLNQNEN